MDSYQLRTVATECYQEASDLIDSWLVTRDNKTRDTARLWNDLGTMFYRESQAKMLDDHALELLNEACKEIVSDDPDDMKADGYETPYQIRASLGL